jgi:hypothetical protein
MLATLEDGIARSTQMEHQQDQIHLDVDDIMNA